MTDKPNEARDSTTPTEGPAPATGAMPSAAGRAVGSPYDSPTEQFPVANVSKGPELAKDVPRTDDELGLDPGPEVPSTGEQADADAAYAYASIPPAANPPGATNRALRNRNRDSRGTLDFGLFALRLIIGGTFIYHGLQKLTGWFHGPGLDGTRDMLAAGGWDHATVSTILVTFGELGGGVLLVLGLASPLAAGALLAVILNAWAWKQGMEPGFQYSRGPGAIEMESILVGIIIVSLFTGPGRLAFDRNRGWATRPFVGSFGVLCLAIVAAVGTFWYLHGGNPFVGIG